MSYSCIQWTWDVILEDGRQREQQAIAPNVFSAHTNLITDPRIVRIVHWATVQIKLAVQGWINAVSIVEVHVTPPAQKRLFLVRIVTPFLKLRFIFVFQLYVRKGLKEVETHVLVGLTVHLLIQSLLPINEKSFG